MSPGKIHAPCAELRTCEEFLNLSNIFFLSHKCLLDAMQSLCCSGDDRLNRNVGDHNCENDLHFKNYTLTRKECEKRSAIEG